jgi:molecular chaperone GrpE
MTEEKTDPLEPNSPKETTEEPAKRDLHCELHEYKDKYMRLLADNENTRKRLQKEKEETIRLAVENTIAEFLYPLDNLETALLAAQKSSPEVKQWASGFQMILSQFREVLHSHGIIAYHSMGTTFDPHLHEAMEIVETEEKPDGTILEEFSKGYKSGQRTIRAARVKVAKKSADLTFSPSLEEEEKNPQNNN